MQRAHRGGVPQGVLGLVPRVREVQDGHEDVAEQASSELRPHTHSNMYRKVYSYRQL